MAKDRPVSEEHRKAISELRSASAPTRRATVPALEEILYEPIPVLNRGFLRVIDYMGDDAAVVQAARVSYGSGTRSKRRDEALIAYLMQHRHTSPFEMCELKLHVKLPIFVARQWIRHRTANVNEYSGRYSTFEDEFYVPDAEVICSQSSKSRQGRERALSPEECSLVLRLLREDAERCYGNYRILLNETNEGAKLDEARQGVARELARINLPVSLYTQWYWKIDLHNLLHFILLRSSSDAQHEIREYSLAISDIVRRWVPATYAAFSNHVERGAQLSSAALDVVRRLVRGDTVDPKDSALSDSEWRELMSLLQRQ